MSIDDTVEVERAVDHMVVVEKVVRRRSNTVVDIRTLVVRQFQQRQRLDHNWYSTAD